MFFCALCIYVSLDIYDNLLCDDVAMINCVILPLGCEETVTVRPKDLFLSSLDNDCTVDSEQTIEESG